MPDGSGLLRRPAIVEVEPITIARLVDRLEARELVVRKADPRDRRVWRLHLTPAAGKKQQGNQGKKHTQSHGPDASKAARI